MRSCKSIKTIREVRIKAKLQWESERPSDSVLAIAVLMID